MVTDVFAVPQMTSCHTTIRKDVPRCLDFLPIGPVGTGASNTVPSSPSATLPS